MAGGAGDVLVGHVAEGEAGVRVCEADGAAVAGMTEGAASGAAVEHPARQAAHEAVGETGGDGPRLVTARGLLDAGADDGRRREQADGVELAVAGYPPGDPGHPPGARVPGRPR